jgi:catechol 2,3-dioxygenase-like lactoylglutathione lyase family enzyme
MSQRVFPQLRMTDWKRSRSFYEAGLGFTVDWTHQFQPDFPVFAQLTRDGMSIYLTEHSGDCKVGGAAYFVIENVDEYYTEISGRGITVAEPPEDTEWNAREITVVDPDGNKLRFSNPASPPNTA